MAKFKRGDKVQVIGNTMIAHLYKIGEIVTIQNVGGRLIYCSNEDNVTQVLSVSDVKLINKIELIEDKVKISKGKITTTIRIGDTTIVIPTGCPIGIAMKHPDDKYDPIIGEGIALMRMMDDSIKKGLI